MRDVKITIIDVMKKYIDTIEVAGSGIALLSIKPFLTFSFPSTLANFESKEPLPQQGL